MCLLIVEDDREVRAALVRVSERFFKKVWWAENALEALLLIEKHSPKAIMTDWDLSDELTGIDVATYALDNAADCKVVLITGNSMAKLRNLTSHLPITSYVAKPFSVAELRQTFATLT